MRSRTIKTFIAVSIIFTASFVSMRVYAASTNKGYSFPLSSVVSPAFSSQSSCIICAGVFDSVNFAVGDTVNSFAQVFTGSINGLVSTVYDLLDDGSSEVPVLNPRPIPVVVNVVKDKVPTASTGGGVGGGGVIYSGGNTTIVQSSGITLAYLDARLAALRADILNVGALDLSAEFARVYDVIANSHSNSSVTVSGSSGSSSGSVTSVDMSVPAGFTISGNPVTSSGTLALGLSLSPNSILTSNASGDGIIATSSQLTVGSILATSTATSTFASGIETNLLNITSTTASSTFANGINLTSGCFSLDGTCISGGGGATSTLSDVLTAGNDGGGLDITNLNNLYVRSIYENESDGTNLFMQTSGTNNFDLFTIGVINRNSNPAIDIINNTLIQEDNNKISVDWKSRQLIASDGVIVDVDWDSRELWNSNTYVGFNWDTLLMKATDGTTVMDGANRRLINSAGATVVDWSADQLLYGTSLVVDWANQKLIDAGGAATSIDWQNRQLIAPDGTTVTADWSSGTLTDGTYNFLTTATGLTDAPSDDLQYLRKNGDWIRPSTLYSNDTPLINVGGAGWQIYGSTDSLDLTGDGNGITAYRQLNMLDSIYGGTLGSYFKSIDTNNRQLIGSDGTTVAATWADGTLKDGADNVFITAATEFSAFPAGDLLNYIGLHNAEWDAAYGWGDHTTFGYLTTESDSVYSANTYATGMNQGVATTDSPEFAGLKVGGYIADSSGANTIDITNRYLHDANQGVALNFQNREAVKLPGTAYTTDGFVKTSAADGTLIIDASVYLVNTGDGGASSLAISGDGSAAASGVAALALGNSASASGAISMALGYNASATQDSSMTIGVFTAPFTNSIANSMVLGGFNGGSDEAYLRLGTGGIYDLAGTPLLSINPNSRQLIASDGSTVVADWSNGTIALRGATPTSDALIDSSGALLTTGGVWTNASDRNLKENFTDVDNADILNKINQLPITRWNYKAENASIAHIGPVAQDFYQIFGLGGPDKTISTIDPSGIALVGIQELSKQQASISVAVANLQLQLDQFLSATSSVSNVSEGFLQSVIVSIQDWILKIPEWAVNQITAVIGSFKKVQVETGLEIKDQATGETYCVTIRNGDWVKEIGACSEVTLEVPSGGTGSTTPETGTATSSVSSTPPDVSTGTTTATSSPITTPPITPSATTTVPDVTPPSPDATAPVVDQPAPDTNPPLEVNVSVPDQTPPTTEVIP